MSVQHIIGQLPSLSLDERDRLRAALAEIDLEPGLPAVDEQTLRRGLAAAERLMNGVCSGGGRHLSADIDAAIYRADR